MNTNQPQPSPVQRFWMLLKPDKKEIKNVYIYAIFSGMLTLSLPLGIQAIINLLQGGTVNSSWILLVTLVAAGVGFSGLLQIYQLKITENLQLKIFTRAAFEFVHRVPRFKMEVLYKRHAPELMNRFFDIISVQKGLSKLLIDFSTALLHIIFGLTLLSVYHPFFIAFSLLLAALVYAIFRLTAKKGLETSLEESKHKYQVAYWLEEVARTAVTFKLSGDADLALTRTDGYVHDYLSSRKKHFKVLVQHYSLMVCFKVFIVLGLLAIGGVLVMNELMNIGQFVAAEIIILLIISAVEKLITSFETIYDVLTSLEKIGQITDLELESHDGQELLPSDSGLAVELRSASFAYPDNPVPTLKHVNLSIDQGETCVIVGKNGSGKSTLLHLIAGLYEVQQGSMSYNGLPKGNFHIQSLRASIGDYLSQEQLFEGTIFENITLRENDAQIDDIRWATSMLGLDTIIQEMPDGYQTHLSPAAKELPLNVVHRILLARSIFNKPRLVVLENALDYFDGPERKRIIDFLTSPKHPWTLVATSKDPYFQQKADKIIVLNKGEVVHIGNYQSVQSLNFYKEELAC